MPRPGLSRAQEQVNILLKFPLEQQVGSETVNALASADRSVRREALLAIEAHELDHRSQGHEAARRISAQLSAVAPSMAVASEESGRNFLSIDDLDPSVGPPEGVPIYNPYTGVLSVYPEAGTDPDTAIGSIQSAVSADEDVERVEPVAIYRALAALDLSLEVEPEIERAGLGGLGETVLGDLWEEAALQARVLGETIPWGVDQIGARAAWRRGYRGQGITVAVVDTGIAPHLDLAPPVRGATFVPGSISFNDDHGHGTHVAGTIAARAGNNSGVVGVAPAAQLLAVKVLARDGYSRGDSVSLGVTWAANNGARIINMSLGSPSYSDAMRRAVVYARSRGVLVCAAAGNDYGGPVSFPAAFDDACLAVAATDRSNRRAAFSNRGRQLDISAPGVDIQSTYLANGYRALNGTSMATPHVAGVAAILLSRYPELTPLAVQRHLETTALPLGAPEQYGRGLVHAERAIAASSRALAARPAQASATPRTPAGEDEQEDRAALVMAGGAGQRPAQRRGRK